MGQVGYIHPCLGGGTNSERGHVGGRNLDSGSSGRLEQAKGKT